MTLRSVPGQHYSPEERTPSNHGSQEGGPEPSFPERVSQLGKSSGKVGRIGSAIVHTGNNCEDEREAEKEERMTIEVSPVESTEAIVIRAGSEFFRLKCRHDVFADTEKENRYG